MTANLAGSPEDRQRHLDWLYGKLPCLCNHGYKSLGVVDHINMGKGWVRTTTHDDCPHHGKIASAARTARHKAEREAKNKR